MFIEQLKDDQIKEFLGKVYSKDSSEICIQRQKYYTHKGTFIKAYINYQDEDGDDFRIRVTLEEFSTCCGDKNKKWIKFLYGIFGEDYKKAFLNECLKVFD